VLKGLLSTLLAAVALTATGCGGHKSAATTTMTTVATGTNSTPAPTVTTHGRYHYPRSLVDNFMRSCARGDTGKQVYCACTLDRLSNNVSTQDFAGIGRSGGKVPPRIRRLIRRATVACLQKS
jgi:hypothetical protein